MQEAVTHTKPHQVLPLLNVVPSPDISPATSPSSQRGSLPNRPSKHHGQRSPNSIDIPTTIPNAVSSPTSVPTLQSTRPSPGRDSTDRVGSVDRHSTSRVGSVDRYSTGRVVGSVGRVSTGRVGSVGRDSTGRVGSTGRESLGRGGSIPRLVPSRASVAVVEKTTDPRHLFFMKWGQFRHQKFRVLSRLFPIIDPRRSGKLTWDILIMVVALYTAVMVPIEVGFPGYVIPIGWRACNMLADALFALDVFFNFFVGFYVNDDDAFITDRVWIARRYLTSWFTLDVFAILPFEYILNGLDSSGTDSSIKSVSSLKLARMIRLARVTKLARLIKLRQFAIKVEDVLGIDAVIARMTQLICQVSLITHLCTCFWHLVGTSDNPNDQTWITEAGLQNASMPINYLYSYYWVVTTLAGVGYGDIHAVTTDERLYSMGVAVVGAAGFGVLIGNMTKILENWNRNTTTRARKMSIVQDFVQKRAIPKKLKANILRYFRHYIAKTSAFDERELLSEFSLSLRSDVLSETYQNTFFLIPAFQRLSTQFVMDMAMYIKPLIAVKGDVLAEEHSVGTEMFIINHGIVEVKRKANSGEWVIVLEILTEHGIFGESSLVNYTLHQNSYTARADCDLYTLPKEDFDRLLEEFPEVEQTLLTFHQERIALYDRVYEQTLARYLVFMNTRNNDPVSELTGIENIYPTLTVLLDGVLVSYRNIPLQILQNMTLEISMGVSVFNSVQEKKKMVNLLGRKDDEYVHWKQRIQKKIGNLIPSDHPWKARWDMIIGLLLVYCAITVPFEIAFLSDGSSTSETTRGDGSVQSIIEYVIECIFTVDIFLNFRTSIVDNMGRVITSNREIARRYVTSWFCVDAISTLPIAKIISSCIEDIQVLESRTFYLFRILRLLKLARLLKLLRTVTRVETISVVSHSTTRVLRLISKVLFIAHLLTCGFYFVALTCADEYGNASILQLFPDNASNYDKYVFSLYWAVATMTTVGYGDTAPGNPPEVAYVTFGVLVGALTFTYVVGTLSSIVDDMHATEDSNRARMDRLKAYLKERGLSNALSARLRRYYEYYLSQCDDENEDTILSSLSDNLRSQTILHLNRDVVSKIAFFATQDDRCVSYLMEILDPEFCTPGEYVFKEGQVGRHMYFLVKGVADILFHADTSQEVVVATLLEGSYFGEIAMLTMAKRAASIRAKTHISLFVLSRSGLDRISQHYPDMANNIIQEFKKKITRIKQTSVRDLGPLVHDEVRSTMKPSTQSSPELTQTLDDLEVVVEHIVEIYGGGDRGKRKALACVMSHLRKYEFSLDDFVQAVEEFSAFNERITGSGSLAKMSYASTVMNKLQHKMRRRGSFVS